MNNLNLLICCVKSMNYSLQWYFNLCDVNLVIFYSKYILLVNVEDPVPAGGNRMTGID